MDEPNPTGPPIASDATPEALVTQAIRYLQAAKVKLQPKTGPTATQQFIHFVRHFRDNPVKNTMKLLALVLSLVLFVVLMVLLVITSSREEQKKESLRRESQSYVAQTQALDNVKTSLNSLLDFVQAQKNKLQESEDIVSSLRAEQEKLKPVVETNRQIIDAILDLQAQKARSDVWKERAIGFGTGILTSIIAAFLLRFFERSERPPEVPSESVDKPH